MVKDDCIFCKLANGDIPTRTLYEDADFRVFMDASPATKGHCLIVPKQHFDNLEYIDDDVASKILPLAKKMMKTLKEKLGCKGLNLVQNNGELAGQTVFHFHMHIIPRYEDDGQKIGWKMPGATDQELDDTMNQIVGA